MPDKRKSLLFSMALVSVAIALFFIGWGKGDSRSELAHKAQKVKHKYVGAAVCMRCHTKEELGRQFQAWIGSEHARSYLVLGTGCPDMIEEEAKGMVEVGQGKAIAEQAMRLGEDIDCLKCHGMAAEIDTSLYQPTFHIEDGVQCEICHGPGSRYIPGMTMVMEGKLKGLPAKLRPQRPTEKDCMVCHREKRSHAVLKSEPFNFKKTWKEIVHPIPRK